MAKNEVMCFNCHKFVDSMKEGKWLPSNDSFCNRFHCARCVFSMEPVNQELLTCGCCGALFKGVYDGSGDKGMGTCEKCVSDSSGIVFNGPIALVRKNLSGEKLAKWDGFSRDKQERLIVKMVDKGILTFDFGGAFHA